jgi:predicted NAD-dependent protein-ADP-ribosyltransferase YbiA (DUF1768 family)
MVSCAEGLIKVRKTQQNRRDPTELCDSSLPHIAPKGLLSNFAETPFKLDGITFASIEAFVQCIKYPPGHQLRKLVVTESGTEAKYLGKEANEVIDKALESGHTANVYWSDKSIEFGSTEHHKAIARAIRAKFKVNPMARQALLETGDAILEIDHIERKNTSLPGGVFCRILMDLRTEIRARPWDWRGGREPDTGSEHFSSALRAVANKISVSTQNNASSIHTPFDQSNGQVAADISKQMPTIAPEYVSRLIGSYPQSEQGTVMDCLYAATRFSGVNGFNRAHILLERIAGRRHPIFVPEAASLTDGLRFLEERNLFRDFKRLSYTPEFRQNMIVVLDEPMVRRIDSDLKFARQLVACDAQLVNLEGFESGLNMCQPFSRSLVRRKVHSLYQGTMQHVRDHDGNIDIHTAIGLKLNEWVFKRLSRAEEDHDLAGQLMSRVVNAAPIRHAEPNPALLADELNGRNHLTGPGLAKVLTQFSDPIDRDAARELIANTMQAYSMQRLSQLSVKLQRKIQSEISDIDTSELPLRFVIMDPRKSFSIVAMIHRMANDVAPELYIGKRDRFLDNPGVAVVLDDFCGTGDSMKSIYNWFRRHAHPEMHVVLAPLVSSRHAQQKIFAPLTASDSKAHFVAGEFVDSLAESDFGSSLLDRPEDLARVVKISGGLGYSTMAFAVALPYGCPNNNHKLGCEIAGLLSLNGRGVKIYKGET